METKNIYNTTILNHYNNNWGTEYQIKRDDKGPMKTSSHDYYVLEYPPNSKRNIWTYATCGMFSFNENMPIELHIFSLFQDEKLVELLTAVSYYQISEDKLNLNHTVNFGVPWQPGSRCSYGLISLPYLDGPNLEILRIDPSRAVHFYWLIPITEEERNYKKKYGIEALEERFDQNKFNYIDPLRKSVV